MQERINLEEQNLHNQNYYMTLKHYTPLCYSGRGVPFFLINDTYCQSLPCIIFINVVFILVIIMSYITGQNSNKKEVQTTLFKLQILAMLLIDLSYFLTIAMNPGIVSEEHLCMSPETEVKFCNTCQRKKVDMSHCNDCQVCVQDLDHHCGFFGRCIAGKQRFAFYAFLLFMFCGFLVIFAGLTTNLG